MLPDIQTLLEQASARHSHLCPRQVLGVRMALAGAAALGLELPRHDKTLLVIAETDGCFVDGLEVAAGVTPGIRCACPRETGRTRASLSRTSADSPRTEANGKSGGNGIPSYFFSFLASSSWRRM